MSVDRLIVEGPGRSGMTFGITGRISFSRQLPDGTFGPFEDLTVDGPLTPMTMTIECERVEAVRFPEPGTFMVSYRPSVPAPKVRKPQDRPWVAMNDWRKRR